MKKYITKFKGLFFLVLVLTTLCAVIDVYMAYLLSDIVDASISKDMKLFKQSIVIAIIYLATYLFGNLAQKIVKDLYIKKTLVVLKKDVFSKILRKDMADFTDENTANYISILTNDEAIIEQDYFRNIIQLAYFLVSFVISIYSLIKIDYSLILIISIGGAITLIIPQLFSRKLSELRNIYSNKMAVYTSKLKDMFSGFEVIKGFNVVNKVEDNFGEVNETTEKSKFRFSVFNSIVDMISNLFGYSLHIIVMMVGVYLTIKDRITIGELIASVQLMNFIINPFIQSVMIITKMNSTKEITNKVINIIESNQENNELGIKECYQTSINFKDVSFSYSREKAVVSNISLRLEKGKKYAIVGESGSGKSTILKLILGYYKNYQGMIDIDGVNIKSIHPNSICKLICSVQQNVYLFDGTIKDNITLYEDYSEEEINKAIKLAKLQGLIERLPNGINTHVGENGGSFSGGERQRISIARAIIKKTPIILLDEATSAIDIESANLIENSILSSKECTIIAVTHRLTESSLAKYDEIIVINEGTIGEQGNLYKLIDENKYLSKLLSIGQDNTVRIS